MDSSGVGPQRPARTGRILDRVVGLRQQRAPAPPARGPGPAPAGKEPGTLEARLARVESALEALQDQLYRETERHDRELAAVRHDLRPSEIARSLTDDARRRGL